MNTQIYAQGTASIMIGIFGGNLPAAIKYFEKECKKQRLRATTVKKQRGTFVQIMSTSTDETPDRQRYLDSCYKLLSALANIDDIHGDAPDTYYLMETKAVEQGAYEKRGSYND